MNHGEAREVAQRRLAELRRQSYAELVDQWLDQPRSEWATAPSGTRYALEIEAAWDRMPHGDLRIWVLVDDGGPTSQRPLQCDFIITADGTFIGE